MGISDKVGGMADKAKGAIKDAGSDLDETIEKVGDKIDSATHGKFKDQVGKGQNAAKDAAKKLGNNK